MSDEKPIEAVIVSETVTPPKKKRGRPPKTQFQKLDARKQKFVLEVLDGKSATEAVINAGYSDDPNSSRVRGAQLMANPKVMNALQEKIDRIYPNLTEKVAERLMEVLEMPIREGVHQKGVTISEFLATARFLQDVYGWKAPTKHVRANLSVKAKHLLPSD